MHCICSGNRFVLGNRITDAGVSALVFLGSSEPADILRSQFTFNLVWGAGRWKDVKPCFPREN